MPDELLKELRAGNRRALSKAITLVESTRAEDEEVAAQLISLALSDASAAWRIGVTGPPGAGKSTLIEALGLSWTAAGKRVAVLAVDPSSEISGGSVLGDKTRMPELARQDSAFIRPSPARATLGGVADRTREVITLCEAAGFDIVIVESVGVGQSDVAVGHLVDWLLVLVPSGSGDELSGMKRGLLEHADQVLVPKCDGDNRAAAERTRTEYAAALSVLRGQNGPEVALVSAVEGTGVAELRGAIERAFSERRQSGALAERRRVQRGLWFDAELERALRRQRFNTGEAAQRLKAARQRVIDAMSAPRDVVQELLGVLPDA